VEVSCFHDTQIVLRGTLGIEDGDWRLERDWREWVVGEVVP
jgi:hypothetical protein